MSLECKLINKKEIWDSIYNSTMMNYSDFPRTTFIQSFEWIKFQNEVGRNTSMVGLYEEDNLVGFGAGVEIIAKRGKYLYFRHGPVLDWNNKEHVDTFFEFAKSLAKQKNLWFIRVSPLLFKDEIDQTLLKDLPKFPMSDVEGMDTWVMDIRDDEDTIFQNIKKKVRYEIRKAEKEGVEIEITSDAVKVSEFYKILANTVERKQWNSYSEDYILKEFKAFADKGMANLILAKFEGKYISGGIFINDKIQNYYHYGASLSEYLMIPSMYLVIWEAIKNAKKKNNHFFNFWGICPEHSSEQHPWYGLSRFKMKFPGVAVRWGNARDIPISRKYWLTNLYERIDKLRKGY